MRQPRHTPIRTCVACRTTDEKRDLLRVVRQPEGVVRYDPKGKLPGRGAYVCARAHCIALARKQKKLERSLKVSGVTEELFAELSARAMELETGGIHEGAPAARASQPIEGTPIPLPQGLPNPAHTAPIARKSEGGDE